MQKKSALLFVTLLVFCFALTACNGKVAVINTEKVFAENNAVVKAGTKYLDALSEELQEELLAAQDEMKKSRNKKDAQAKMQKRVAEAQQRYGEAHQEVMSKVNAIYMNALEECRKKGRYSAIVVSDAVPSYDPKIDVTQKIIDEMNKSSVTFKAVAPAQ